MIGCFSLLILAFFWLQLANDLWMLYLFAVVYGFGHGGHFTLISPLVAERFGIRSHGVLFRNRPICRHRWRCRRAILAGHLFDITGSYVGAFWICAAFGATALGLLGVAQAKDLF